MIIGSCSHELVDFGNHIVYNSIDRYGDKCKISSTVCDECLTWFVKEMDAVVLKYENDWIKNYCYW